MSAPAGMAMMLAAMLLRSDIVQPIHVIDGDTLSRDGVAYRLAGFDAPEITRAKCAEERALGLQAKARMRQLASDPAAMIEPMPAREKFGRTLARLWIGSEDAASIMIREGLALPYDGHAKVSFCQPRV
jgi:micrococcal nuclease